MKKLLHERRSKPEAGFTLIELLVVLVVMPLLIGAIAEVLITMMTDSAATNSRLSDSVNAQVSSEYFVRDVQGASRITTDTALSSAGGTYSQASPQICGPGTTPTPTLLLGLYRPAATTSSGVSSPALDVGYWLTGSGTTSEVDRYACTLSSTFTSTPTSHVVMANVPTGPFTGSSVKALVSGTPSIQPTQFATWASTNWTPVASFTITSGVVSLSSTSAATIPVEATLGFSTTNPTVLTVETTAGPAKVQCQGATTSSPFQFSGCLLTGGPTTATAGGGAGITQANVSSIELTVTEPSSSYQYRLLGAPVGGDQEHQSATNPPTLLALGGAGLVLNGTGSNRCAADSSNKDKVCVNGNIVIDGGVISCGTGGVFATGGIQTAGSGTCNGAPVTQTQPIGDPELGVLPSCIPASMFNSSNTYTTVASSVDSRTYQKPGRYQVPLSGVLEPGIYVAEDGLGNVTMAPVPASAGADPYFAENSSGALDRTSGVLIFFPAALGSYGNSSPCLTAAGSTTYSLSDSSVAVAPLDSNQSLYYFNSSGAADVWGWQDSSDPTAMYYSGNNNVCSGNAYGGGDAAFQSECGNTSGNATGSEIYGLGYFPSSVLTLKGNPGFYMGRLDLAGYSPGSGTPYINLSGS